MVKCLKKFEFMLYIGPWFIGFLLFKASPLIASLFLSFTDFATLGNANFIGFKNYIDVFTYSDFYASVIPTLKFVFFGVSIKLIFSFFIALLLWNPNKFTPFLRTIYYFPSIIGPSVAIAFLWRFMFQDEGYINFFLKILKIPIVYWLSNSSFAIVILISLTVWQFGSSMIIFLSGLMQIPDSYFDTAKIYGANRLQSLFLITIPLLIPTILFNLLMQTIFAFQSFDAAFLITNGGPAKSTYLYGLYLYNTAFRDGEMGLASAISWILFLSLLGLSILYVKLEKRYKL